MDFGEVLTKAGKIIWKHKVLWIFGILAGCAGGQSGSGFNYSFSRRDFSVPSNQNYWPQVQRFFENIPTWVWILAAVSLLALILLGLFLGTVGRIALIRGTVQADNEDLASAPRQSFGPLFNQSLPFFWRVFLLNLVVFVFSAVLIAALIIPTIGLGVLTGGVALIFLLPLLCFGILCLVVVFWAVGLILEQAMVAIVSNNVSMGEGLQQGWRVVRDHLGQMLVLALIIYIGGGILRIIIALPAFLIAIPIAIAIFSQTQAAVTAGLVIAAVLIGLYLPIAIFFGGVMQSYIGALWTLTFRRLSAPKPAAPSAPELAMGGA